LNFVLEFDNPTQKIRKALAEAMPTELFDLYETILTQITNRKDNLALRTLSWVLYAKRPLHINELRHAIATEEGDSGLEEGDLTSPPTFVKVCGSFIVYDTVSGVVELAHKRVKEFLLLRSGRLLSDVDIAATCLTYLLFDVFDAPCSNDEALLARSRKFSFARYAAQFWGIHSRGKAESFPPIQKAVLLLLASENKKNSMLQLEAYSNSTWPVGSFTGGQTLLHVIAAKGLGTICRLVLDRIINQIDKSAVVMPSTLIERNKEVPQIAILSTLPETQTDISGKDNNGGTALHLAAQFGHGEVVQWLLDAKANMEVKDNYGQTALICAAKKGHNKVVKLLLDVKADMEAKDSYGQTALTRAAEKRHNGKVVRQLMDAKANMEVKDNNYGQTALSSAANRGHD
jgi:Ankyrin repeats (3 copies)